MTIVVTTKITEGGAEQTFAVTVSGTAERRARLSFNPSGNESVSRLKALAAALYTELETIAAEGTPGPENVKGREAATAATQIQLGAMMAVSAATA